MTAAEIVMKRDDLNIAWGFRLTGGADLGTPFYVVKVLGRGHAERAGLRVGDMVYAINHKYTNNFTHKDAQNEILHTGDTLILNIKRGPTSRRGTPLPEYTDPLMGIVVPPETPRPKPVPPPPYQPPPAVVKLPSPPESEDEEAEDTVAAFNVKINPKGRIAEIEELPVTPPRTRSPSQTRSRSRSASRDRRRSASAKRESAAVQNGFVPVQNGFGKTQNGFEGVQNSGIPGPGETFTYSKEVITQYSTVLSASEQSEGNVSETVNESFVIHGGSRHKMEDVLSPEDIERDIFEEKMEEQKLTELLTGEAEVLEQGVVGNSPQIIMGTGKKHSVSVSDKASNTDKTPDEKHNPDEILMPSEDVESPCSDMVILKVEENFNDLGALEVHKNFDDLETLEVQENSNDLDNLEVQENSSDLNILEVQGNSNDLDILEVQEISNDLDPLEVQERSNATEVFEVQRNLSHDESIEEKSGVVELESIEVKLTDNYAVPDIHLKEPVGSDISSFEEHNEDSGKLNKADILEGQRDQLHEKQILEDDEIKDEAGLAGDPNLKTADVAMTTDKPLHAETNIINDMSANMTKPALIVKKANDNDKSGSSCTIL